MSSSSNTIQSQINTYIIPNKKETVHISYKQEGNSLCQHLKRIQTKTHHICLLNPVLYMISIIHEQAHQLTNHRQSKGLYDFTSFVSQTE